MSHPKKRSYLLFLYYSFHQSDYITKIITAALTLFNCGWDENFLFEWSRMTDTIFQIFFFLQRSNTEPCAINCEKNFRLLRIFIEIEFGRKFVSSFRVRNTRADMTSLFAILCVTLFCTLQFFPKQITHV